MQHYPGAKGISGHLQQIVSLIPQCDLFIEAMSGSAVISNYLRSSAAAVVTNDYNRSIQADTHLHYKDLVATYDYWRQGKVVFYFDPPYMMETRSYKKPIYKHDWTDKDHHEFLSTVRAVKSNCMISHYPCPLYDDKLSSWRKHYYKAMTRAGLRTECVYMNFEQPTLLLCCSVVGNNRTHRQQIKRKKDRLLKKILALPQQEQAAIITAIQQKFIT